MAIKQIEITIFTPNQEKITMEVEYANSFWSRFKGLMGRRRTNGLYLTNSKQVHMFFMRIPLDVYYINEENFVIDKEHLKPWQIGKFCKKAKDVLEMPPRNFDIPIGSRIQKGNKPSYNDPKNPS